VEKLEEKIGGAQKEAKSLEKKKNRLAADVERLKAIKAEYMDKIKKYKKMRVDLVD
jgi:hypothetical protein